MVLTDLEIANEWAKALTSYKSVGERAFKFARGIEAEVSKQDDALIRQLVEALERARTLILGDRKQLTHDDVSAMFDALTAGRARLEGKV